MAETEKPKGDDAKAEAKARADREAKIAKAVARIREAVEGQDVGLTRSAACLFVGYLFAKAQSEHEALNLGRTEVIAAAEAMQRFQPAAWGPLARGRTRDFLAALKRYNQEPPAEGAVAEFAAIASR